MKKSPSHKHTKKDKSTNQDLLLKKLSQSGKNLNYRKHPDGSLHLYDETTDTNIAVKRSHEGYSHFACWYVTDCGKIKKDYPLKEKSSAIAKGISIYLEKLSNEVLKKTGGKNG
jgi:hypothetical protein